MNATKENTLGQLTADNFQAARIFEEFGLDFCCNGKKSLEKACNEKGVNPEELIQKLNEIGDKTTESIHFSQWDLDFLIDYILNNHHSYVRNSIISINHHFDKVINAHGEKFPELSKIKDIFNNLSADLTSHMLKEEKMLFPYIKKMSAAEKNSLPLNISPFGSIKNPITVMEEEHSDSGSDIEEIKKLTNNFTPPEKACNTFRVLYEELKDFEKDLHIHIHLENNILFPRSIDLEEKLLPGENNMCDL